MNRLPTCVRTEERRFRSRPFSCSVPSISESMGLFVRVCAPLQDKESRAIACLGCSFLSFIWCFHFSSLHRTTLFLSFGCHSALRDVFSLGVRLLPRISQHALPPPVRSPSSALGYPVNDTGWVMQFECTYRRGPSCFFCVRKSSCTKCVYSYVQSGQ